MYTGMSTFLIFLSNLNKFSENLGNSDQILYTEFRIALPLDIRHAGVLHVNRFIDT